MKSTQGTAFVNGAQLHYEMVGDGPALVLIHGNTLDIRMWDEQVAAFAERYRVIRYDMRGFGRSAPPSGEPYTPADDLAALLTHLGVGHAHILGLSLGGAVAMDFVLAYPEMTDALILADTGLSEFQWQVYGEFSAAVRAEAVDSGVEAARQRWLAGALFAPVMERPQVAQRLRQMVDDYSGWHWLNRDSWQPSKPAAIERFESVDTPTLVIIGERDLSDFHEIADAVQQRVPGASKAVIAGVGHISNMEAPAQFNTLVLDFLADHS
ncbi:3-oxoadipate enol-lactonase 2 [Halioglobus japonicus]|nr:3-oxoadipate enol-lactonase 2 [Halioglobus japonicus]